MLQQKPKLIEDDEQVQVESEELDIATSDYGFIISADGELKTFFCPDNFDGWPPKEVMKIFKIFNITDISGVLPHSTSLH